MVQVTETALLNDPVCDDAPGNANPVGHQETSTGHLNGVGHDHGSIGYANGQGHQKFHGDDVCKDDEHEEPALISTSSGEVIDDPVCDDAPGNANPVGHQETSTGHLNGVGHDHESIGYANGQGHQKFHGDDVCDDVKIDEAAALIEALFTLPPLDESVQGEYEEVPEDEMMDIFG